MKLKHIAVASTALAVSLAVFAQQPPAGGPPPQDPIATAIKGRQAAYTFISWNVSRLDSNLKAATFNKDEAVKAANAIAGIANSGMGALFPAGSDKGTGFHATEVKPELWKEQAKVADIAGTFAKSSSELAKVAATGDKEAVKVAFNKLRESCKACHDAFKQRN